MDVKEALAKLVASEDLSVAQMRDVMRLVMTGDADEAQIGALLVALRMKGETVDEITGAAQVMRDLATPVDIDLINTVDTCGTGGDGSNLFNVSTAAAFVVAAAGGRVAKHGNRSVSSSTGSADLLEQAGVNLDVSPDLVARAIEQVGVGFMFAQAHHGAMKYAIGPRKSLGMRTIFNILGPLTNPAKVKRQVMGVFDKSLCRPIAEVLQALGSEHVLVVHSEDGLDEFSIAAKTHVAELKDGEINEYSVAPSGYDYGNLDDLSVTSAAESLSIIERAFSKAEDPVATKARDMIALNAGAAIYVAGVAASLADGIAMAEDAILSGLAAEKMKELAEFTRCEGE